MVVIRGVRLLIAKCVRSNSISWSLEIKGFRGGEPNRGIESLNCAAFPLRSCSIKSFKKLPEI